MLWGVDSRCGREAATARGVDGLARFGPMFTARFCGAPFGSVVCTEMEKIFLATGAYALWSL